MEAGELKKQGIWICGSLNEVKRLLRTAESAASFRFALLEELPSGEELKELLPLLPFRVLAPKSCAGTGQDVPRSICTVEDGDWKDIQDGLSAGDVTALWKAWLKRWPEVGAGLSLYVYLDQDTNESPTLEWRSWARNWNNNTRGLAVYASARDTQEPVDQNRPCVVWDRHARVLDRLTQHFHVGRDAWILLDKMSEDFATIFLSRPPEQSQPWTLPLELMEAGLLRVVVVDERVAEQALQPIVDDSHVQGTMQEIIRTVGPGGDDSLCRSRWMAALLARIYIVTHVVKSGECRPLHPAVVEKKLLVFDPSGSKGPVRLGSLFQGKGIAEKFDMLIVHHGVLEDLCGPDREKIRKFLNELGHKFPFIVIESGRGVPATLPGDVKFLPFSVVGRCLLGRRIAKYRLVRTVMGLTRRG
jgi:hypothetical protein